MSDCPVCGDEFDEVVTKQEMFGEKDVNINTSRYDKCIGGDKLYLHSNYVKPIVYNS